MRKRRSSRRGILAPIISVGGGLDGPAAVTSRGSRPPPPAATDLGLQQRPALAAEFFFPGGIDARQLRSKRCLIDVVEDEAAFLELVTEARVESGLLLALLPYVPGGMVLDHRLDVGRQRLPGRT